MHDHVGRVRGCEPFSLLDASEDRRPTITKTGNERSRPFGEGRQQTASPDGVILVYDGDSGVRAMLLDAVKKTIGREDCALCEITYSPIGKRRAWTKCASRLGVTVAEMHRDELPDAWGITRAELPCVLARVQGRDPFVLVTRDEIGSCGGSVHALERALVAALNGKAA